MTSRQEQQVLNTLLSLEKGMIELKDMLKPYTPKHDEMVGTKEAMAIIGVGSTKLKQMIANGELPFAMKIGSKWKFSKKEIMNYLRMQE